MIAILGLSDAGKSTWLGCMFDVLEGRTEGPLRLNRNQQSYKMLAGYRNAVLSGKYPRHTPTDDVYGTRFEMTWRGEPLDIDISDYSGERISQLHHRKTHEWDDAWIERADCTKLCVLLRADKIARPERHDSSSETAASMFPSDLMPDTRETTQRQPPTALALVEALQVMREHRGYGLGRAAAKGHERISVVLTAWDAVLEGTDPKKYLADNASLLSSWLDTNLHPADVRVFGMSATGGDLGDAHHCKRVIKEGLAGLSYCDSGSPSLRSDDISLPIQWLLEGS